MTTLAQEYIKENGPALAEASTATAPKVDVVTVDAIVHWNGLGTLAPFAALQPKLTQKYRLFGEKCVVTDCTDKVDAPKYIMELVGAPLCTMCAQKISLQQIKGQGPDPYKPEFEKPTSDDIAKAKAAGISLPGWE